MRRRAPPSTAAGAAAPAVDKDFIGVRIACPADVRHGAPIPVSGVFRLAKGAAKAIDPRPHRGLVLVVMHATGAWWVTAPFREVALFDDDEQADGEAVRGHFEVDAAVLDAVPAGDYWISASLGEWLSNALKTTVS